MSNQAKNIPEKDGEKGLTPIPQGIHCPATADGVGATDELDEIMVENFLDTLARVARNVAARKAAAEAEGEVEC